VGGCFVAGDLEGALYAGEVGAGHVVVGNDGASTGKAGVFDAHADFANEAGFDEDFV
jgi:hypothetical protein